MYKRIDFENLGGNPMDQDSFMWMQDSYRSAFAAIAAMIGTNVIISGMAVAAGNISNGWFTYNGELIPFTGGALGDGSIVIQQVDSDDVEFQNGDDHVVEIKKVAVLGGPATLNYSQLTAIGLLKRIWLPGDLKEVDCSAEYIAANFDGTGKGINERIGWAICNGNNGTKNRGGRVSIGYTTVEVDPVDGVWDELYKTIGAVAGEKKHQLVTTEMPAHSHTPGTKVFRGHRTNDQSGGVQTLATSAANADPALTGPEFTTSVGDGQAHENRQPFIVTLFIQKL